MQKVFRFWHLRKVRKAASLWVAKQDRGLSVSEQQELFAWLAASPIHREALREFDTLWHELDTLSTFDEMGAKEGANDPATNGLMAPAGFAARLCSAASGILGWLRPGRTPSKEPDDAAKSGSDGHNLTKTR